MEPISVVLADDHALFREGTRNLLEQTEDLKVVGEAADGMEAVEKVKSLSPDIVVMDVVMPRLTGIEATRQIKASNPGTAVLILSAHDDDRYVLGLLEAGVAGYVLKSAHGDELIQAIRAIKAGEAVLHPAVISRLVARASSPPGGPSVAADHERPTDRELDVLKLAGTGLSNKEIAGELVLSVPTVKAHLVNIFNKMGVGSRTEAVLQGLRLGWISMEDLTPEPPTSYPAQGQLEGLPEDNAPSANAIPETGDESQPAGGPP